MTALRASRSQLHGLRIEAVAAGDDAMLGLCVRALEGDAAAHRECTAAIVEALGNDDPGPCTVASIADMLDLGWTWYGRERVIVTAGDWRIHATMDDGQSSGSPGLCWCASDTTGRHSDESGGWDTVADIEQTLRDLGGGES